ncbi:IclR family transcriptional regulator [Arthrobacter caoxuetaonis]|uniref:Helix-turn-helix domain-containing protein n=1 Tax=Arthrobacter caoxuetaonis TaxID=2886935 RepID=A0A9X1MEJ0_9MICC|nr:helix-turn-helix domain-containing protein [Arthrobacter caoxuetaonis]MCC3298311.1 helix-turn-helix domain-containing protein [Arthrobacter caoxuetaonis]USQ57672.1 helix-turn-helix domain-containing protein [Arthrobacter caoxuetaonis]
MAEAAKADSTTRTVERALALLSVVCQEGAVTQSEAAKAAGLSTSTALRLLRTLEGTGFVRREENGTYRPGAAVVQLGVLALSSESLIATYRAAMDRIVEATGESTYLSIPAAGGHGLYIAIAEGTQSVRHANWVGRRFQLEGSAAGKAMSGDVGASGCAVVGDGVEPDITAIAVPLTAGGKTVAAMSVVVPSYRMTPARIDDICRVLTAETSAVQTHG